MRTLPILMLVPALALMGCAGAYDRELLGDPAPAAAREPAQEAVAQSEYADSAYDEALIHTPADYAMFDELGPYGAWYETPEYGVIWRPVVSAGWQPYVYGYWIWTSYEWMWVSYEPFGWATYHYGNWWLDPVLGWIWIPGYTWAPCPVDWFYMDGYLGWAPLPPPGCAWDDPWVDEGKYKDGWVVVETGKFKDVDVGEKRVAPERFKSAYRTGTAVRKAPDTRTIERATRQVISETNVRIDTRRVGDHELRKVVLPSREQQIVDRHPMPISSPGGSQGVTTAPTGTIAPPSSVTDGKSKGASQPAKPVAKESKPAPFKSKDSAKDSQGKSKGEEKKDDGKSKGGDKDDNGGGKAKGKKR